MLIVLLTNRKDYEPFLSDVVFAFDGFLNQKAGVRSQESEFGLTDWEILGILGLRIESF